MTFANSLDTDQAQQSVGPDLYPNCLTLLWYSGENFFKNKLILKKISRQQKIMQYFQGGKELTF